MQRMKKNIYNCGKIYTEIENYQEYVDKYILQVYNIPKTQEYDCFSVKNIKTHFKIYK